MPSSKIRFTDLALRSLRFSDAQTTYWDEAFPAFGLRVGKRSKTFIVIRNGGHRVKIGAFPATSLQDARKTARRALYDTASRPTPLGISADQALTLFLESRAQKNKPSTHQETERLLNRHLRPVLTSHLMPDVTTEHITRLIDTLLETPSEANHLHTAAKTFFNWAVSRRYIRHSPMDALAKPAKPGERERVLTDYELAAIYRAARKVGRPFGYIVLICIHTGMRRGEVAALKWSYITKDYITLPSELTKNHQVHRRVVARPCSLTKRWGCSWQTFAGLFRLCP